MRSKISASYIYGLLGLPAVFHKKAIWLLYLKDFSYTHKSVPVVDGSIDW